MSLPFPNRIGLLAQMSVSVGGGINKILRWACNISRMNPCEKLIVEHLYNKKCIAIEIGLEKFNLTRFVFLQRHFFEKHWYLRDESTIHHCSWKFSFFMRHLLIVVAFKCRRILDGPFLFQITGLLVQMLVSVGGINKILA